ncbi:unnamed protein product [Lactuca saligna]|uniref:Uncharacterized protein n=1 Tax=Lactuca saligna TaxID=75948 RepID=A0AA35YLV4_LACSI|nr:unnamed protein product [Lactuca saligna]
MVGSSSQVSIVQADVIDIPDDANVEKVGSHVLSAPIDDVVVAILGVENEGKGSNVVELCPCWSPTDASRISVFEIFVDFTLNAFPPERYQLQMEMHTLRSKHAMLLSSLSKLKVRQLVQRGGHVADMPKGDVDFDAAIDEALDTLGCVDYISVFGAEKVGR